MRSFFPTTDTYFPMTTVTLSDTECDTYAHVTLSVILVSW